MATTNSQIPNYTILAGISFPFRIEGAGLPASAFGPEVIRSALIVLLRTSKGSRVMRPKLGNAIQKLVFEVQGPALQALLNREILSMISNNLPQVVVQSLNFANSVHLVQVNVVYTIQGVQGQTGYITLAKKG